MLRQFTAAIATESTFGDEQNSVDSVVDCANTENMLKEKIRIVLPGRCREKANRPCNQSTSLVKLSAPGALPSEYSARNENLDRAAAVALTKEEEIDESEWGDFIGPDEPITDTVVSETEVPDVNTPH